MLRQSTTSSSNIPCARSVHILHFRNKRRSTMTLNLNENSRLLDSLRASRMDNAIAKLASQCNAKSTCSPPPLLLFQPSLILLKPQGSFLALPSSPFLSPTSFPHPLSAPKLQYPSPLLQLPHSLLPSLLLLLSPSSIPLQVARYTVSLLHQALLASAQPRALIGCRVLRKVYVTSRPGVDRKVRSCHCRPGWWHRECYPDGGEWAKVRDH